MKIIPPSVLRWLAILMPPVSILALVLIVYPRVEQLHHIHLATGKTDRQIQSFIEQIKAIDNLPPNPKIASLPLSKQEQSDFLRGLSMMCSQTGNRLISLSCIAPPLPPPPTAQKNTGATATNTQKKSLLPPDVTEIKSVIVFEGSFNSIRAFLTDLDNSRRLISLSDCRLIPGDSGYPTIQMSLGICRYVDTPPPPPSSSTQTAVNSTATASTGGS